MGTRLTLVEKKIIDNTNLLSNPDATKDPSIKDLSLEVAKLGNNYQDLISNVKSLKDITSSLQSYLSTLKENITSISVCNKKIILITYNNKLFINCILYQIGKIE